MIDRAGTGLVAGDRRRRRQAPDGFCTVNDCASDAAALADATDEDDERVAAVNLTGTFDGMREGARRPGEPDDVAGVASSLAGPDGRRVDDRVVEVNGGRNRIRGRRRGAVTPSWRAPSTPAGLWRARHP